ncbi:hypothetical protein P152DRAFT_420461 [Eremomyces bilateralis CBS 781.70]|uniref:MPN domain-containing protein n=1 Tax=Eremomyces bilateralis CBS 781.70 TaxID=1392243 RepID=A0A6G1FXE9_9PEZI|nr:uncharacterized protein P152DRAFT_420461 [Eremomyces bilateralis CBS 781.70]KAF1810575.1 hypothetical protein P152DRAFT_420461 [Eremomyces bilateralis CBS 781.70]
MNLSTTTMSNDLHGPPRSVESLAKEAADFEYEPLVPLRYWLRAADAINKQAHAYERDGDDQDAYLLLLRHAILIFEKLQLHPEARQNRVSLTQANNAVKSNLARLEHLKPRIRARYERHLEQTKKRNDEKERWLHEHGQPKRLSSEMERPRSGSRNRKFAVDATEHRDLAVKLARHEFGWKRPRRSVDRVDVDDDVSQDIAAVGKRSQQAFAHRSIGREGETAPFKAAPMPYPSVPKGSSNPLDSFSNLSLNTPPVLPRKESLPPSRPRKLIHEDIRASPPPLPQKVTDTPPAALTPRSMTPAPASKDYTFKPSAFAENGTPLRTIFISPDLRRRFLQIAQQNTLRSLETCGILCGRLISNALFVSHLVIPEQEATSDTCEMVNEETLVEFCDANDLMTLGWIHTHPTQTCFMSSRDLHTHGGYQIQMAESIAIVCAPRHDPSWGIFRLTDPPGLKSILNCTRPGIFHPHEESNIYTDASRPGHVCEASGLEYEVVDLRPG